MRKKAPVKVLLYRPTSEEGKQQLSKSVAEMHSNAVNARIKELNCPTTQKLQLLDAIVATAKQDLHR